MRFLADTVLASGAAFLVSTDIGVRQVWVRLPTPAAFQFRPSQFAIGRAYARQSTERSTSEAGVT